MAETDDDGIGTLIGQLADDAKAYAAAEADYYKAVVNNRGRVAKAAAIFAIVALLLAHAALIALSVGAVLSLASVLGPLAATAIVSLVALALAAGFGWLGYRQVLRLFEPLP